MSLKSKANDTRSKGVSLVNKIKVFTSLAKKKVKETFNTDSSLNGKDPILFLLGLISLIIGAAYLRTVLSGVLNKLLPTIDDKIRELLKFNNITEQSSSFNLNFSIGIPMTLVDYNDKFKIDPNTIEGQKAIPSGTFTYDFRNNVLNGEKQKKIFGDLIEAKFNENQNIVSIGSIGTSTSSKEEYLNNILSNIKVVDTKMVTDMTLDALFNTISKKKSLNGIKKELELEGIIQNILDGLDSDDSFEISIEGVSEYEINAQKIKSGVMVLDFGCSVENLSLDRDFLNKTFNDPLLQLEEALNNTLNSNEIDNNTAILENFRTNAIQKILMNIIKGILFSPEMIFYLLIRNLQFGADGNLQLSNVPKDPKEYLKQQYSLIKIIICKVKNELIEYIFQMFKKELLKLVLPVIKEIVKEKILSYKNILLSLLPNKKIL